MTDGPLIVQSDKTLLLEVDHADAEAARRAIAPFAELERAPEHVHTYRLTPLGLWNARAAGHDAEQVVDALITHSRYAVPHALLVDVADTMDRYGRLSLEKDGRPRPGAAQHRPPGARGGPAAQEDPAAARRAPRRPRPSLVHPSERGHLKQELLKVGWPAEDLAGYVDGEAHPIALDEAGLVACGPTSSRRSTASGTAAPASSSCPAAPARPSSGAGAMARPAATTLILVTNTVSARQWQRRAAASARR